MAEAKIVISIEDETASARPAPSSGSTPASPSSAPIPTAPIPTRESVIAPPPPVAPTPATPTASIAPLPQAGSFPTAATTAGSIPNLKPIGGSKASEFVDVRKEIEKFAGDSVAALDALRERQATHLASGGQVSHWFDGKEIPITRVENGNSYDAKGQPWGMLPMAMGLPNTKNGVEFKSPSTVGYVGSTGTIDPAGSAGKAFAASAPGAPDLAIGSADSFRPAGRLPDPESPGPGMTKSSEPREPLGAFLRDLRPAGDALKRTSEAGRLPTDAKPVGGSSPTPTPSPLPEGTAASDLPGKVAAGFAGGFGTGEATGAGAGGGAGATKTSGSPLWWNSFPIWWAGSMPSGGPAGREVRMLESSEPLGDERGSSPQDVFLVGPRPLQVEVVRGSVGKAAESGKGEGGSGSGSGFVTRGFKAAGSVFRDAGAAGSAIVDNRAGDALKIAGDGAAKALSTIAPAAGAAFGALVEGAKAVSEVVQAFIDRGRELAQYNGQLAATVAITDVQKQLADIREGERLGPQMAELIEKSTQLDLTVRELLSPIKDLMINVIIKILDGILSGIQTIVENIKFFSLGKIGTEALEEIKKIREMFRGSPDTDIAGWLAAGKDFHGPFPPLGPDPRPAGLPLGVPIIGP